MGADTKPSCDQLVIFPEKISFTTFFDIFLRGLLLCTMIGNPSSAITYSDCSLSKEPKEDNPMLGWHGVRRSMDEIEIIKAERGEVKKGTTIKVKYFVPDEEPDGPGGIRGVTVDEKYKLWLRATGEEGVYEGAAYVRSILSYGENPDY